MIENDRVQMYIHSLDSELSNKLKIIEKAALDDEVPIIKKPTQTLLQFLVRMQKPKRI